MVIPSPPFSGLNVAGFEIKLYALGYLIGLFLVIKLLILDLKRGKIFFLKDDIYSLGVVVLLSGILGARIYHILTTLSFYYDEGGIKWLSILNIRNGGLGIPGGILGGILGGYLWTKLNKNYSFYTLLAYTLPNILLAQAIGRLGNYFNQELYGKPTNGVLRLEIDPEHRISGFSNISYFHPTFLYESLACLTFFLLYHFLLKEYLKNNYLKISYYFLVYGVVRFFVESLRIDFSPHFLGLRLNQLTSLIFIAISIYLSYKGCAKKFKN